LNSTDEEVGFVHDIELTVWPGGDTATSTHRFSYEGPRTPNPNCPLYLPFFCTLPVTSLSIVEIWRYDSSVLQID
jgi:hypothetical protein